MTVHSPVGMQPSTYKVVRTSQTEGTFANNDLEFTDLSGANHEKYSFGLAKSLLNYMHGIGIDLPLQHWFEHKVPRTEIKPTYIQDVLENSLLINFKASARVIWVGQLPAMEFITKSKKGINGNWPH